jgi:hypothetical protein
MRELTEALFKFLYAGDPRSLEIVKEHKKEIENIAAHFVPPGGAKVVVQYGLFQADEFEIRGINYTNLAFERLEFLGKLGLKISIFDNELDFALSKYVVRKDRASYNLLKERHVEIEAIEEDLAGNELKVKINMGIKKTKGFVVKGVKEVALALEMLYALRNSGIHVERPRVYGAIDPHIAQRLRATFG